MKRIITIITIILSLAATCQAADTAEALKVVFRNEGGLSLDPHDSGNYCVIGGKRVLMGTKYGIAASVYGPSLAKQGKTIRDLRLADAARIYDRDYAAPLRLKDLKSQWLANMVLDTAVNCGAGTAAILLARTVNVLNGKGEDFPVDPYLGKEEVTWINEFTRTRLFEGEKDRSRRALFGSVFKEMRSRRYVAIVRKDPGKLRYLPTWLERTYE